MLKSAAIFLGGIVLGTLILYVLIFGISIRPLETKKEITVKVTPKTEMPKETPQNAKERKEILERLRTRLYQQGITVKVSVDKVYPGTGFIVVDDTGASLFIRWKEKAPATGEIVNIKGIIKRLNEQETFRNEPGFTQELSDFLRDQSIYIEASEVIIL